MGNDVSYYLSYRKFCELLHGKLCELLPNKLYSKRKNLFHAD